MAIYKTFDDTFVIASGGMWLPGGYENERVARYAFQFTDSELLELRDMSNARGDSVIRMDDLRLKRSQRTKR